jgi:hypothetical protein
LALCDKAAGQQAALTEGLAAVSRADVTGLIREIEGFEILRFHHGHRIIIHIGVGLHIAVLKGGPEVLVELVSQRHAGL